MSDTVNRYELSLRPSSGEVYSDVLYAVFFRNPLVKNASFAVMRINISAIQWQIIQGDISKNNFPKYKLMVYMVDKENKRIKQIGYRPYIILSGKPMERVDMTKPEVHIQLLMMNPVIHQMESALSYNKILENMKSYDAILDFEKHIKNVYGDCFQQKHFGMDDKHKNDYKYEQILTFASNDLSIPSFIIDSCKPTHVSPFYFFDDFALSTDSKKDIACVFINPSDKSKLTKFDLSKYFDIEYGTAKIGKVDFTDPFGEGIKTSESAVFQERENTTSLKKEKTSSPTQQMTVGSESEDFGDYEGRGINFTKHNIKTQAIKQSIQYRNAYVPDDTKNAKKRIDEYGKLVKETVDKIELFETRNCLVDWLQFGRIYNLIKDNRSSYLYTPISIVNIFTRENDKEFYLRHSAKYTMLKYFDS